MVIFYKKGNDILSRKYDDFVPNKGVEIILGDKSYIVKDVTLKLESNEVTIDLEDKA